MIMQANKKYRTRGGYGPNGNIRESVEVQILLNSEGKAHPWIGYVYGKIGCWNNDGTYALTFQRYMDLVEV